MEVPGENKPYTFQDQEADLARVNVLRMRGDLPAATTLCREVLAKSPESEHAHALMGDILMDSGELHAAADWFEMAASHAPLSTLLRKKADQARQLVEEHEAMDAARRWGIPTSRKKIQTFAIGMLVMVVAVSLTAFILGGQMGRAEAVDLVRTPLEIGGRSDPTPQSNLPQILPAFELPKVDKELFEDLNALPGMKGRLLLATFDPRDQRIVVSLEAPPGEFTKVVLAEDAELFLTRRMQFQNVTIRYLRSGEPLAMAEMSRADLERVKQANGRLVSALKGVWPRVDEPSPDRTRQETPNPAPNSTITETPERSEQSESVPTGGTSPAPR